MCTWKDNVGYMQVNLYKDGNKKYIRVHRLVAEYFVPNPYNKPFVNHIDGDKTNNHYSNLEWVDNRENVKHFYSMGGNTSRKPVLVLGTSGVWVEYPSITECAKQLKINRKTLTAILNKEKSNTTVYKFVYKGEGVETIESVTCEKYACE